MKNARNAYDRSKPGARPVSPLVAIENSGPDLADARATVEQCEGSPRFDVAPASLDRIISNYVLDLLSEEDMRLFVAQAERALAPEGRLCLVSLTHGTTPLSRLFIWGWERLHALSPRLVGGCRPIEILDLLADTRWRIEHINVVTALGMPSEVVVAVKP